MEKVSEGVEPVFGCKSKEIDMGLFPFGWSAAISASSSHESKRLPLQHRELDLNYDMAAVAQAQIARRNVTECLDLLPSSRANEESCFSPQIRFQNPAMERPQAQLREQNFLQPDLNRNNNNNNLDSSRPFAGAGASGTTTTTTTATDNGPLFNVLEKEQIMELLRSSLAQEICDTTNFGSNLHEHLFYKVVTPSDVGKLNRLVIPKQHAERFFPLDPSLRKKGRLLSFQDSVTGELWWFRYSYWSSSQSYVLTKGWIRFVKDKNLRAGDIISFERGSQHELYINCRRRPTRGIIISDEEQDLPGLPLPQHHPHPSISHPHPHSNLHSNLHHAHAHAHVQASAAAARPVHLQSFLHNLYTPSASAHILASSDLSSSTSFSHTRIEDHIIDPDFSPPIHRPRSSVSNSDTRLFGVDLSAPKAL